MVFWSLQHFPPQISALFMLYPLANLANLLMWGLFFLGATWAYAKYRWIFSSNIWAHLLLVCGLIYFSLNFSGEFSHVGVQIEELTAKVWDNVFQPLLNKVRVLCIWIPELGPITCIHPTLLTSVTLTTVPCSPFSPLTLWFTDVTLEPPGSDCQRCKEDQTWRHKS